MQGSNGILKEAETYIQGGNDSSIPENKTEKTGAVELGKKQETLLEQWAKEKNIWIDNTTSTLTEQYGISPTKGGEAKIYTKDNKTVVKEISLAYYIEPQLLLDRIVLHNTIAPDTPLTLTHFGRNNKGEFVIIAEQPYIEGTAITQDAIVEYMDSLGFKPYNKQKTDFINETTGLLANDIHDENVIKDVDNFIHIIDGGFRLNTANYGLQGKRTTKKIDTSKYSPQLNTTLNTIREWYKYAKQHLTFDKETHQYFMDGVSLDTSATGYAESIYGKKDIQGDYSHSVAIGNSMDAIYRDFFETGINTVISKKYPNINDTRKQQIINDLNRFNTYLDNRFGIGEYKVITTEFPIAAYTDGTNGVETIAGMVDMMVIDKNGDIHIFDFKTKNHPITQTYYGKEVSDRRDYTAQANIYKNILETIIN